jgi:hypothetical protein
MIGARLFAELQNALQRMWAAAFASFATCAEQIAAAQSADVLKCHNRTQLQSTMRLSTIGNVLQLYVLTRRQVNAGAADP